MHFLCSESKDADQLHGYPAADLRLFISHTQKAGFFHDMSQITSHCDVIIDHTLAVAMSLDYTLVFNEKMSYRRSDHVLT